VAPDLICLIKVDGRCVRGRVALVGAGCLAAHRAGTEPRPQAIEQALGQPLNAYAPGGALTAPGQMTASIVLEDTCVPRSSFMSISNGVIRNINQFNAGWLEVG